MFPRCMSDMLPDPPDRFKFQNATNLAQAKRARCEFQFCRRLVPQRKQRRRPGSQARCATCAAWVLTALLTPHAPQIKSQYFGLLFRCLQEASKNQACSVKDQEHIDERREAKSQHWKRAPGMTCTALFRVSGNVSKDLFSRQ